MAQFEVAEGNVTDISVPVAAVEETLMTLMIEGALAKPLCQSPAIVSHDGTAHSDGPSLGRSDKGCPEMTRNRSPGCGDFEALTEEANMSRRNGDRARFQINRKRKLRRRQRVRALMTAIVARRAPQTTTRDDRQRLEEPRDTSGAPE